MVILSCGIAPLTWPSAHPVPLRGHLDLERLLVFHRPGPGSTAGPANPAAATLQGSGFRLSTCQREVDIHFDSSIEAIARGEVFRGIDAYRFLLEFATGLRSAIPGETNVFGQLRSGWREYLRSARPATARSVTALMDALFVDTRSIRTAFLQDIGGHSYGTLTRKLLQPAADAHILVVGHGELARSLMPMLSGFKLGLINRTRPTGIPAFVEQVFDRSDAQAAVDWADHVVLCVPRASDFDTLWVGLLASRPAVRAIHLGCRRANAGPWTALDGLATLDDLFDLRSAQQSRRARQLELARAACRARALERATDPDRCATSAQCT